MLVLDVIAERALSGVKLLRSKAMQEGMVKAWRGKMKFEQPSAKRDRFAATAKKRVRRQETGARIRWLLWNIKGQGGKNVVADEPLVLDIGNVRKPRKSR
eukprot:TRINITY_DN9983_c0_g2_i1.p2 TRINITY_DN9983_c0_g2~~TRINITY_DN9983_c0_g2_i1.p2  ORF type:complete len:100 (-),score=12.58 TRINITY_DN9983_c0_g2_i1:285-584(-)